MSRFKLWMPFAVIVLFVVTAVWKTRYETLKSREIANAELERRIRDRERADKIEAAWNPGHLVPMTEDVFGGVPDEEVRPTPVDPTITPRRDPTENAVVRFSWQSGATDIRLDRSGDGSNPFLDRALSSWKYLAQAAPPTERR